MNASALLIDALGLRCPEPLLRLRTAMREHPQQRQFVVLADDPMAPVDLGAFCARFGHSLVQDPGGQRFEVSRANQA